MAIEKILNTRIQLKYDSYSEWTSKNPTLKAGELAIAYLAESHTTTTLDNGTHPVLFKVGPGAFNSLPWASALAADVYAWAKKETPDWNDFPALPVEVIDNGTGKFITGISYANNKITITRSNVDWSDVQNKPEFDKLYKAVQDAKNFIGSTVKTVTGITQNEQGVINVVYEDIAFPAPVDISGKKDRQEEKEYTGSTTKTVTKVEQNANGEVEVTFGDIDFPELVYEKDTTPGIETSDAVNVIRGLAVDGHTITETLVAVATPAGVENAKHTHSAGDGLKITPSGKDIKYELQLAFAEELTSDNKLQLIDSTTSAVIAEFNATNFIEDSYLNDVDIKDNILTFTWKMDDGSTKTDSVDLTHLVDVYSGAENDYIKVSVDGYTISATLKKVDGTIIVDNAITTSKVADKNITEAKLSDDVATKLNKQWQPIGNYKTEQSVVTDPTANGKALAFIDSISQDKNGVITATKKNVNLDDYALSADIGDGQFTVSGSGALEGSGSMTANQKGNTSATLDVKAGGISTAKLADSAVTTAKIDAKAVTTAKVADAAIGAAQTKAYQATAPKTAAEVTSEEIWVFNCGSASVLV